MKRTVCITGATAGFGEACARLFAKDGWRVIITGRRQEKLEALLKELTPAPVFAAPFDVRDKQATTQAFADLPEEFQQVDVLVNNAGLALGLDPAHKASMEEWDVMVDTNIKGLLHTTHALLPGMVERKKGHIVNLASIAGNYPYPSGNVYGATKAFVKQFTLNLMADLLGTNVRVTNIEPGMAETEFSLVRFRGDENKADNTYKNMRALKAEDIADSIHWAVTRPPHVNISRLEIWPTDQSFSMFSVHRDEDA